jgi:hypothetical protein
MNKLIYLSVIFFLSLSAISYSQEKPLLSNAIRKAIDTRGVEGAKKYFKQSYAANKNYYEVDMEGVSKLSNEYVKNNNTAAAGAVMEMAQPYLQDYIATHLNGQSEKLIKKQNKEINKNEAAVKESSHHDKSINNSQGPARDDLDRFTGIYGDPSEKNETRRLWVRTSCDGYLVAGALWGDASPWWLKSESDKVFIYKDSFNDIRMEFAGSGKDEKMIHNLSFMKSPLQRLGPIPEDWGPCVERREQ